MPIIGALETLTEFIDLSDIPLTDIEELEAALPCFCNLKQVDMVNCGFRNTEMNALREFEGAMYVESPDKSSGKHRQHIRIKYGCIRFIPLEELMK